MIKMAAKLDGLGSSVPPRHLKAWHRSGKSISPRFGLFLGICTSQIRARRGVV